LIKRFSSASDKIPERNQSIERFEGSVTSFKDRKLLIERDVDAQVFAREKGWRKWINCSGNRQG
jgi:hypothetical protein